MRMAKHDLPKTPRPQSPRPVAQRTISTHAVNQVCNEPLLQLGLRNAAKREPPVSGTTARPSVLRFSLKPERRRPLAALDTLNGIDKIINDCEVAMRQFNGKSSDSFRPGRSASIKSSLPGCLRNRKCGCNCGRKPHEVGHLSLLVADDRRDRPDDSKAEHEPEPEPEPESQLPSTLRKAAKLPRKPLQLFRTADQQP
jgi:hypothetical protein